VDNIVIAIDGPAGAGKSTIAKIIAEKLNIMYIDTGAMYRAATLSIIRRGVDIENINEVKELVNSIHIEFIDNRVYLDGMDVTLEIRLQEVTRLVSYVATILEVRERLVKLQRDMASSFSIVMDGRDIGTNVLKNAGVKIFLTASVQERAQRRFSELASKGCTVDFYSIKNEILNRDRIDSSRKINPLIKAADAIEIDTTQKTIDDVVEEILSIVKKR